MANKEWQEIKSIDEFLSSTGFRGKLLPSAGKNFARWGRKNHYWATMKESTHRSGTYLWLIFGDWRNGDQKEYYCQPPDGKGLPSKKHQGDVQKDMEKGIRAQQHQAQMEARGKTERRLQLWDEPTQPTPYLERKKIGDIINIDRLLRAHRNNTLIVVMTDNKGIPWGYQQIMADGSKYYSKHQKVAGTYHLIEGQGDRVYVCEGYATGASIRLATGSPVFVLFSTSNMKASIPVLKDRLRGKEVVICADNDRFTDGNPGLATAEQVAEELNAIHIWPVFPDAAEGKPTDFNDFHALNGLEALENYINREVDTRLNIKKEDPIDVYGYRIHHKMVEGDGKLMPKEIARLVLREHAIKYDSFGGIYLYENPIWRPIVLDELKRLCSEYDAVEFDNDKRRTETAKEILNATFVRKIEWNQLKTSEIVCSNGVYNLVSEELRPHRADDYIDRCPPHNFVVDHNWHAPRFLQYLEQIFEDDPAVEAVEKRLQIQMFLGYCLMAHAKYKKAMLCLGETNTGKSVLAQVIQLLTGIENICSIDIQDMDNSRKLQPIQGKMVNIINEPPSDALFADGGFKRLVSSGDEYITIDPKYKAPFIYHPTCKHAIFTNSMPGVRDSSEATYQRLMVINFNRQFKKEEQDPDLIHKLKEEAEGIFNWAVEGAYMLYAANGSFPVTKSGKKTIEDHRLQQNTPWQFFSEFLRPDITSQVSVSKAYNAYNQSKLFKHLTLTRFINYLEASNVPIREERKDGNVVKIIPGYRFTKS